MRKIISDILQKYTTGGLSLSFLNLMHEMDNFRKHRKGKRNARKLTSQSHLLLNIGCGSKRKSNWINIDLSSEADIMLDMREPLPFMSESCSILYSEHFLEHLDYPNQTQLFLKECFRVLEPGGLLNLGVPDTEWPIREYNKLVNEDYFKIVKECWHPAWCITEMEHINYHFRQEGEHRFSYDYKTLERALHIAGFVRIARREFDPHIDEINRKIGTLYVNAYKPDVNYSDPA